MTDQPDFDGCHRQCRTTGAHTLVWGGCEHATPPEPAVTVMRVRHLSDGAPGLVCESIPVTAMAARIEALLRAAQGGGYAAMARAVAENLTEGEAPHEMQGSADTGGLRITDPHEAGEAHGCPEECPVHNPGGPDVPRDAVWGTWAPSPTDADFLLAVEGALEQAADIVTQAIEPLLGRLRAPATPGPARHVYLSTGCYHGDHGYCQNPTGLTGAKAPAVCKFCHAPCICPCHRAAPGVREYVETTDDAGPGTRETILRLLGHTTATAPGDPDWNSAEDAAYDTNDGRPQDADFS